MATRELPPLKSLVYFEAAARLQSFTAASEELSVTQGAVSRQIRQLEEMLGRALFHRDRRRIVLTDDGHNYYISIVDVLDQLESATERLTSTRNNDQVTIVTSSAVASLFLLPLIPEFRREYPGIQIRIIARDDSETGMRTDHDLSLYYVRGPHTQDATVLFTETVFPVCSPAYFKANQQLFARSSIEGLKSNLIWLESKEDWINWPEWFEKMELQVTGFDNRLVVNNYSMVIQAAIAGQGVALAWAGLVDSLLADQLLVTPSRLQLDTEAGFVLQQSQRPANLMHTECFHQWLAKSG